ncbi:MAG: efflux RND transporter permease subunit [Planctomycetota bacterium]
MILSDAAIKNRTTVGVLVILIVIAGVRSYLTLPRESAPDIEIPIIQITTPYEGASPTDIESLVTIKIENKLSGLDGVKEIRSTSQDGLSLITVEFLPGVDIEDAMRRVRDKVDLAQGDDFPIDAEEPVLTEINIAEFPIMMISISGDISPVRLKAVADQLEDAIEALPGVLNSDVIGALEREIRLEIDPDRVAAYGLTVAELVQLIPSENVNTSAGGFETGRTKFNVRVPAEFDDPDEVNTLVLAMRKGKPIYLRDVGRVRNAFKDIESISRLNGSPSITVTVQKRIGADILSIAEGVKAVLAEARGMTPEGVEFTITMDQSDDIKMMVKDLENNILSGLILVALVLVLFMGARTSLIVALAIPLSMLMSFAAIQMLGHTLNMIVLFSLILALGMLVDNAIVIVENVYRHMQFGRSRIEAAMTGTREVAWPVIASTATTIAAFSPLLFWPGMVGDFMKYLPITLIITLSSSLLVAMMISPVVCSIVGAGRTRSREGDHHPFVDNYRRLLGAALRHRRVTLITSVMALAVMIGLYAWLGQGMVFFPKMDPNNAIINVRAPQGTSIYHTDSIIQLVEHRLQRWLNVEGGTGDLKYVVATVGSGGERSFEGGGSTGPHVGNLTLTFRDFEDRPPGRESLEVLKEIREIITDIPGAEIKIEGQEEGPPTGEPVTIRISGKDFDTLEQLSEQVKKLISPVPGLVNLRSDYEAGRPELAFRVDRRRAMLTGVNTALIGRFLKTSIYGRKVGNYRQFNDEYDITVRLPLSERTNIEDLFRLHVPSSFGHAVPLSTLGDFEYTGGFGNISRVDRKRVITLTGRGRERGAEETRMVNAVKAVLADSQADGTLKLPPSYAIKFAGKDEEQTKAFVFLLGAFVFACLLIVGILVLQFNTLSAPLIIMSTIALSTVGVMVGLIVCRIPFSVIMTGIGVISLAGVVVNNAIVLLDYTRQLQRRGRELIDAAIEAGTTRLRPVLLTAATTIMGLIPMATGVSFDFHEMTFSTKSESSQWWASMAIAVIFGLAFATMLTLVVVPTLYVSLYRMAAHFGLGGLQRGEDRAKHPELSDF